MAYDRLSHQLGGDQLSNAAPWGCGVIGNDSEVSLVLPNDLVNDPLRRADGHETTDHQARAVGDHRNCLFERDCLHLRPIPCVGTIWQADVTSN
jgi:hypothetical protein